MFRTTPKYWRRVASPNGKQFLSFRTFSREESINTGLFLMPRLILQKINSSNRAWGKKPSNTPSTAASKNEWYLGAPSIDWCPFGNSLLFFVLGEIGNPVKPTNPITTHHFLSPGLPLLHWGARRGAIVKGPRPVPVQWDLSRWYRRSKAPSKKQKSMQVYSSKIYLYKQSEVFFQGNNWRVETYCHIRKKENHLFFSNPIHHFLCVYIEISSNFCA